MKYACSLEGYCCSATVEDNKFKGVFMQLHPSPSGHERHILRYTTNVLYDTENEAVVAMEDALNKT